MFNDLAFFVVTVVVIHTRRLCFSISNACCVYVWERERKRGGGFKWKRMQNQVSLRNNIFNTDRCPIRNESGWKKIDNNRFPNCEFPRFFTFVDVIILSAFRSLPHFYGGHVHMGNFLFTIPMCDKKNSKQKKCAWNSSPRVCFVEKFFFARTQTAEPFEQVEKCVNCSVISYASPSIAAERYEQER